MFFKSFSWVIGALSAATLLTISPARAEVDPSKFDPALIEKVRKSNDECFRCHTEAGVKNPAQAGMDLAKLGKLVLDPVVSNASNHGNMECKQCHGQGYNAFPHAEGAAKQVSPCEECHAVKVLKIEKQFDKSVHATNLKGKMDCNTCHEPHTARVAVKIGNPREIVIQDNGMCIECHSSDLRFSELLPAEKAKKRPNLDKIHSWLPNTQLHWDAVRCVDCHTPQAKTQSHEIVDKDKAEKNCVTCHSTETALRTRLYRHLVETEQKKLGFLNSVVLSESYVIGATRNPLLDFGVIAAVVLTILGVLGHGAVRILMALIRRRNKQ